MPGRLGSKRGTVKNSLIIDVRPRENLLLVKGGVIGAVNQMVLIHFK
jgi:ribosomal protein L3